MVLTTILGAVGGGVAWSQTDLEYLAGGSLWIQAPDRGQAQSQGPITGAQLLTSSSWIDLLRSLAVLNTVAVENRLYLSLPDTTFRPTFASFGIEERFVPGDYELLYSPSAQTLTLFRDGLTVDSKRSSPELCVKVRGSSSMLLLGCLGDLLRFEKREIQVATFAPDRSSP